MRCKCSGEVGMCVHGMGWWQAVFRVSLGKSHVGVLFGCLLHLCHVGSIIRLCFSLRDVPFPSGDDDVSLD